MDILMNRRLFVLFALVFFVLAAAGSHTIAEEPEEAPQTEALTEDNDLMEQADMLLEKMSLEEKAAQLFIITPEALTGMGVVTQAGETTRNALETYPVGGLIYMEQNIESASQLADMTASIQSFSTSLTGLPLFLCVDEEGGSVRRISGRIAGVPKIPDMWSVGRTGNPDIAYLVGSELGSYLSGLGINVDLAPVADVVADPALSAIGDRSFGPDPLLTGMMAASCMRGIRDHGILAALKHFPGHGAVEEDSHTSAVISEKTLEELESEDLIPFMTGIDAGASLVMAGHITFPNIADTDTPASLSHFFLTRLLREKMGYEGLIITDALNMGAVTDLYEPAQAAVMAVNAGADLILMPQDFHMALQGVIDAVNSGTITEDRLDESVRRIIDAKLTLVKGGAKR